MVVLATAASAIAAGRLDGGSWRGHRGLGESLGSHAQGEEQELGERCGGYLVVR